uniref:RNase_Zc3h12a domain-containing protein n=1 Tax=Steinernema glaseri TaxID=37863 RepID=A0A1I7XXZ9_9BILA
MPGLASSRDPEHEAFIRGCVMAYAEQIASNLNDLEEDIATKLIELQGMDDLLWYKTRMECEQFAVRFGYTREEFLHCVRRADERGIDVDVEWLLEDLSEIFGDLMRVRNRVAKVDSSRKECPRNTGLRPIIIDGLNVARADKHYVEAKGLKICVDFFLERGHCDIQVVLPSYFKDTPSLARNGCRLVGKEILLKLDRDGRVFWTPSMKLGTRVVVPYDDQFVLKLAQSKDGVIVSNDEYRDLQQVSPEAESFIEQRLVMYSFFNDNFFLPDLPQGADGPSVTNILRNEPLPSGVKCPFGSRCTYGKECKFDHITTVSTS